MAAVERKWTVDEAAGYVAAMIDGEGHVALHRQRATGKIARRAVIVTNTESDIIEAFVGACGALDVTTHVNRCGAPSQCRQQRDRGWSVRYDVHITGRRNLERLASVVLLASARKERKLQEILDSYTRPNVWWDGLPIDELRRLYEVEGLSMSRCADYLGCSITTIHRWIHLGGIQPKPVGRVYA